MSTIERKDLVTRHNPVLQGFNPRSPLSVGNGEFAFTADITGLQSFPELYDSALSSGVTGVPLCTQAQWGWHSVPLERGMSISDYQMEMFDTHGRKVGYPTNREGQEYLHDWLRENPHRLHLGRIGFRFRGRGSDRLPPGSITHSVQTLDLWTGILENRFRVEEDPVTVHVCCHPNEDGIAVRIESGLLTDGRIEVVFEFPYGSHTVNAAVWGVDGKHSTVLKRGRNNGHATFERRLDEDGYFVDVAWEQSALISREGAHLFALRPSSSSQFAFQAFFRQRGSEGSAGSGPAGEEVRSIPGNQATFDVSASHWRDFWSNHGAVELAESRDERALELERRIVLSQYLTAIQCAGSIPPQETGLTCNSWNGKFHLEMHWWHAVHFALWDRADLLEKSMAWYCSILPRARQWAGYQGYRGARWPKMAGPDGRDSPSTIGPLLIWQQPHPITYAELLYLSHPEKSTLEQYADIVFETADFMASYAWLNPSTNCFDLGPPLIPAQENHAPMETVNPTYELEYWAHALGLAQRWRERLGLARNPEWEHVRTNLAPLPRKAGLYLAHANCPGTYVEKNFDHPSMLGALGLLPGAGVDREVMRKTLEKVEGQWNWERAWGWDFPMAAMTAARLDEPERAVDLLLMDSPKNGYLENGHNTGLGSLLYLPGNGGTLAAVAMMAAGWQTTAADSAGATGTSTHAPGFPRDGSWTVRWEGLNPWL